MYKIKEINKRPVLNRLYLTLKKITKWLPIYKHLR